MATDFVFNPVPVRERRFDPDTMLQAAQLSLAEAERYESNAEEQRSRDATHSRTSYEAMRDELLLANVQASIAIAEALTADKRSAPDEPSKLKDYDYACEEPCESEDSLGCDLGEIQLMSPVPHIEIHVHGSIAPPLAGADRTFRP